MSNDDQASAELAEQVGRVIPGGCDSCNAEQELQRPDPDSSVFVLQVRHDDWCPFLASRRPA